MPDFKPDITQSEIMTALRTVLLQMLSAYPGTEVVQGQGNRVPPPSGQNYVVMWPVRNTRLATTVDEWEGLDPASINAAKSTRLDIQIDVHGPDSSDMAGVVSTLWRSLFGVDAVPGAIFAPLYASEPRQIPFINAEHQYETRWIVEASLQVTPRTPTPMQFADRLTASIQPPVDGE